MGTRSTICRAAWLLFIGCMPVSKAAAQDQSANVHWAYSAYFGSGWYQVENDRDVFVFRVTPEWELAEPSVDDNGDRQLGWYLRTPFSTGLDRFDIEDLPGAVDLDNVTFLSFNPGVELEIPVNKAWSLRPYASIGYGGVFGSSESAWTYWGGIKSRVRLHSGKRSSWNLVNNLGFVGYTPSEGKSDSFWPVMTGLEVSHPFGSAPEGNSRWLLHWNVGYTYFGNDIFFSRAADVSQDITDQWEVGIAIGKREDRVKVWVLSFDRLGIGYRTSSNGALSGITFIFKSTFAK